MRLHAVLGFVNNPEFTDEKQKCMVWSAHIYVMLMAQGQFDAHNRKNGSGLRNYLSAFYTLPLESLHKVNEVMASGLSAGATEPIPMIDEGFMQVRALEDYDGHRWDFIFLDMHLFSTRKSGIADT